MKLRQEIAALDRARAALNPEGDSPLDEATLYRDRLTGRAWLHFVHRPTDAITSDLKAAGWRWSGYRGAWHNNRRFVRPPASVRWADGGEVDYASERAERLEGRADRAQVEGEAQYRRAKQIADAIPLGQPILVGHHSERRHRRDIARIQGGFGRAMESFGEAKALESAARHSAVHQEHLQSAPAIQRRLDRARADLRSLERREQDWQASGREEWLQRVADVRAEVERAERALAEAGGPVTGEEVGVGDLVRIKGWFVRVSRVGPKSISGTITEGGAAGMTGKWDRSHFQGIVEKAAPSAPGERQPKPKMTDRDRLERDAWRALPAFARGRWSERSIMLPASMGGGLVPLASLTEDQLRQVAKRQA